MCLLAWNNFLLYLKWLCLTFLCLKKIKRVLAFCLVFTNCLLVDSSLFDFKVEPVQIFGKDTLCIVGVPDTPVLSSQGATAPGNRVCVTCFRWACATVGYFLVVDTEVCKWAITISWFWEEVVCAHWAKVYFYFNPCFAFNFEIGRGS